MRLSLRYRLLMPLSLLLVADFFATAWAAWLAAKRTQVQIDDQLHAVARTLGEPPTFPLSPRVLEQMRGLSGAEFLLVRPNGERLGTLLITEPLPASESDRSPSVSRDDQFGSPIRIQGYAYRYLRVPLLPPHPNEGSVLFIFYPEAARQSAIRDAVRPLLLLGGVGGVLAIGLMMYLSTRLVKRVQTLQQQTRLIADGLFEPVPVPKSNDELRDLLESVNQMAEHLATYRDALTQTERLRVLGQFSGGLAHQLRNAAGGARLALQLHLAEEEGQPDEALGVALRQLSRMETMLSQFLSLGKPAPMRKVPCDLNAVIGQAIENLQPQCRHTGTILNWIPAEAAVSLHGDAVQLTHLFGNVIGNAIEAAGPDGTVTVRCHRETTGAADPGKVLIEVRDTGPGPPDEIANRLFDSFVTGKEQGIGLGLAVARQAAVQHGGSITWTRQNHETVFRIELSESTAASPDNPGNPEGSAPC